MFSWKSLKNLNEHKQSMMSKNIIILKKDRISSTVFFFASCPNRKSIVLLLMLKSWYMVKKKKKKKKIGMAYLNSISVLKFLSKFNVLPKACPRTCVKPEVCKFG